MNNKLTGSNLARAMLARGDEQVWCAVADDSDEQAMMDLDGNDFTAYVTSFKEDQFFCSDNASWSYAVPIKIVALTQEEAGL